MSDQVTFDARALTDPLDVADFAVFRRSPLSPPIGARVFAAVLVSVVALAAAVAFALIIGPAVRGGGSWPFTAGSILTIAILVLAATLTWRSVRTTRVHAYRLARFASANGMQFLPRADVPPLPGMIFGIGRARRAENLVRAATPRWVEFADYQFKTGSGKTAETHRWQYVAVQLHTLLPHIVLDATSNNFLGSNLPIAFGQDQRLSLEGDFDKSFALYCPAGYERDALYLFTPDVMANVIDTMGAFDVEIVDSWVFLYSDGRSHDAQDPQVWAWRFRAVQALLSKIAQWERWRDDRLATVPAAVAGGSGSALPPIPARPPAGVAHAGRRLRRGVSWVTVIVGVVFVAVLVVQGILDAVLN